MSGKSWRTRAACAGESNRYWDPWFPSLKLDGTAVYIDTAGSQARAAYLVCRGCEVRAECLADAMDAERGRPWSARHGIYGGLSPQERYRADVTVRRRTA